MDRVQIPKFSSEAGAPFEATERWKASFFAILVEFLEQSSLTSPPEQLSANLTIDGFRFLNARLRPDGVPGPLLERRLANRLLQILTSPAASDSDSDSDDPKNAIIVEIIAWGGGSPAAKFNDPGACATILEALSTYSLSLGSYQPLWVFESINRFRAVNTPAGHVETPLADPIADGASNRATRFVIPRSESDSQSENDTVRQSDSRQTADGGPQVLDKGTLQWESNTDGEGAPDPGLQILDQGAVEKESDTDSESDSRPSGERGLKVPDRGALERGLTPSDDRLTPISKDISV
jgi:hypothetical protein